MENDICQSRVIIEKVKNDKTYAQSLYAALCNNSFQNTSGEVWSCSWRYSGGIISKIRNKGDYLDWYCSGIFGQVPEGTITDEISNDLLSIGWKVCHETDKD